MSDVPAYHRAIAEARRVGLALAGEQEKELLELLAEYAAELAALIDANLASARLVRVYREVDGLFNAMSRDMAARVGSGIRLTASRVVELQARAVAGLLSGTTVAAPTFAGVNARAAQAVISRPELAESFVTLRRAGAAEANRIIKRGVLRGAPPRAIQRNLRMYVGAPDSLLEGDEELLGDLRRIGYGTLRELGLPEDRVTLLQVRKEAGAIRDKAQLIGRTEIASAEHEAHAQAVAESPVVKGLRVQLSARHAHRDQCDSAAEVDLYGLGAGVYPTTKVPSRFHPRCLCVFLHVLRAMEEWGTALPAPPRLAADWDSLAVAQKLSPSQIAALRASVELGEQRRAAEPQRRAA